MKQCIKGKPIRFGFKQWAMCCSESGYCFHGDIYGGKCKEEQGVSGLLGAFVIVKMTSFLQYPSEYEIFFDNFFITLVAQCFKLYSY